MVVTVPHRPDSPDPRDPRDPGARSRSDAAEGRAARLVASPRGAVLVAFAAPLAWSLHELVIYIGTSNLCHLGWGTDQVLGVPLTGWLILVATIVALAVTVGAVTVLARLRRDGGYPRTGDGTPRAERAGFTVHFGLVLAALATFGIVLEALPVLFTACG